MIIETEEDKDRVEVINIRHRVAMARFAKYNPGVGISIDVDHSIKKVSKVNDDTEDERKLRELEKKFIEKYGPDSGNW